MDISPSNAPAREAPAVVPSGKRRKELRDWLKAFGAAALIFAVLRIWVFDVNEVSGTSMEPAFRQGDKVIVEKISYRFRAPARGDVVVFTKPGSGRRLIKRVVAGPGDLLWGASGTVYVNSEPLLEPYVHTPGFPVFDTLSVREGTVYVDGQPVHPPAEDPEMVYAADTVAPNTVPEHCYFVLGDNRGTSVDSLQWGFVPDRRIIGRTWVRFTLFPPALDTF